MHLDLSTQFQTKTIEQLLDFLKSQSPDITSLDLNNNHLGVKGVGELTELVNELAVIFPDLRSLYLSLNALYNLPPAALTQVFEAIARLPRLRLLDLGNNQLHHSEAFCALSSSPSLQVLGLSTMISRPVTTLAEIIENLSSLQTLSSVDLSFQKGLTQKLFQTLAKIPDLQMLNLENTGLCEHSTPILVGFFNALSMQKIRFLSLPYYIFTDSKGDIQRPLEQLVQIMTEIASCAEEISGPGLKNLSDEELVGLCGSFSDKLISASLNLDWTEKRSIEEWLSTFRTLAQFPKLTPNLCLRGLGGLCDGELRKLFDELARNLPNLVSLNLMHLTSNEERLAPPSEQQIETIVLPYLARSKVDTFYYSGDANSSINICEAGFAKRRNASLQRLCLDVAIREKLISHKHYFFSGSTRRSSHELSIITSDHQRRSAETSTSYITS